MDIKVVFEDEYLLVIDKPAGVVVNRADTTGNMTTVQDWVDSRYKTPDSGQNNKEEFLSRSGIVHRLDKDTSGLLVVAKIPEAFERLKDQFKNRTVEKKYLALVHGWVKPESGAIRAPIARSPFNPKHFGIFPGGREAETDYRVLENRKAGNQEYSLLELIPHTGRTHQIRVHLKYINHPIVSDPIYGGRKNLQADLKFCPRLFLHATFLKFEHPVTNIELEFVLPLPSDLQRALDQLQ